MKDDFPEREPLGERSAVSRYYNAISMPQLSLSAVMFAVEDFYEGTSVVDDDDSLEMIRRNVKDLISTTRTLELLRERLMVLPLLMVAPYVELSRSPEQVGAWYKDVVGHVLGNAKPIHDAACAQLMQPDKMPDECNSSRLCPVIKTANELVMPIYEPDFNDLPYRLDPRQAFLVAKAKLGVAKAFNLGDVGLMDYNFTQYKAHLSMFFCITVVPEMGTEQS